MSQKAKTVEEYIENLSEERRHALRELRRTVLENLPPGFAERISYGMPAYVVPHSLYPDGYHCDPSQPLPFMSIASQKNSITIYHMGLYAGELLEWFQTEWKKESTRKLDMGKSCVRFKKFEHIPLDLIGRLANKMTAKEWIEIYEAGLKKQTDKSKSNRAVL